MGKKKENEVNYVYILQCADDTLYTGWTNDLEHRIQAHNSGKGAKYTKGRTPCRLMYFEIFELKNDALKREAAIKKLKRYEKEKLIEIKGERKDED